MEIKKCLGISKEKNHQPLEQESAPVESKPFQPEKPLKSVERVQRKQLDAPTIKMENKENVEHVKDELSNDQLLSIMSDFGF